MSIFSRLFSAKNFTIVHPDVSGLTTFANEDFNATTGVISTLLTCEKVLADQLSSLPLEIYRSGKDTGKIKEKEHPLYRLLHSTPNGYQTQTLFFQQLEKWRNHYGNAFAKINRIGGKVKSLELIHPLQMQGFKIRAGKLYFWRVDETGKGKVIHNDDILHFRFISDDGVFGLNPIQVLYSELNNIHHGKYTLNNSYRNGLNIDKVIESVGGANFANTAVKEAVDKMREDFSGTINFRKVPVLPTGFKVVPIQSGSIQDAQILQSIEFSKRDIAALYGVPLNLIGLDGGSYNSIEQNTLNFKSNVLRPIARMYRQEIEAKLLTDSETAESLSIEFNLNSLVETDQASRVNYLKSLHGMGVISSNDVAKLEGFETYEGGEKHFIQSQYIPVEEYEKYSKIQASKKPTKEDEK